MTAALPILRDQASELAATLREDSQSRPVIELFRDKSQKPKWFPGLAKRLSKDKPAAAIHHLTGERERTCYDWCGGAVDPPSRAIIKLLHSEVGWHVLEYLMRGCKQAWWLDLQRHRQIGERSERAVADAQAEFPFARR